LLIKILVLYLNIIKTKTMNDLKKGQKFEKTFTTPFGKKVTQIITIVAINGNSVLMDSGETFHTINLI